MAYQVAVRALGLADPIWTTDGEILNIDRMAHYRGPRVDEGVKFTTRENDPVMFQKLTDFLGEVITPTGFAYKDVVHPFVVSEWYGLRELRVLKIQRDVAEVAFSMFDSGWLYPRAAARLFPDLERSMIEGLLRAQAAIADVPGVDLRYDDLITRPDALENALRLAYDDDRVVAPRYIGRTFRRARDTQLWRRGTERYRELQGKAQAVGEALRHERRGVIGGER